MLVLSWTGKATTSERAVASPSTGLGMSDCSEQMVESRTAP